MKMYDYYEIKDKIYRAGERESKRGRERDREKREKRDIERV